MTDVLRGRGQPVLYLDYDGVMHHEDVWRHPRRGPYFGPAAPAGATFFQNAGLLEEALAPFPRVLIVLSTSWVRLYSFSKARARLPASLQQRVVGATWHSRMRDTFLAERGQQVLLDVQRRQPSGWVALEDDCALWPEPYRAHLVACCGASGLADPAVRQQLREKLERACR